MADEVGCDLDEITIAKYKKNAAKYPADEFRGNSAKYNELKREKGE